MLKTSFANVFFFHLIFAGPLIACADMLYPNHELIISLIETINHYIIPWLTNSRHHSTPNLFLYPCHVNLTSLERKYLANSPSKYLMHFIDAHMSGQFLPKLKT